MKTFKYLYSQIYSFANLEGAFRKARRGKRNLPHVATFEHNLDQELLSLQAQLQARTYKPSGYRHFMVYDGKPRRISAAPFRDRVVHHALCNIIEPIWEARFFHDSYACRVGKGTLAALDRCTHFARRYPYVLQCDIVQFFPSVDHAILRKLLARHIACKPTLNLVEKIIVSGEGIHDHRYKMQWFTGDDLLAANRPRGLPIGNQTSQFWANVYLHALDQFVKQELRCQAYVRYCDDFMLFAPEKPSLHQWRREIEAFLVNLRLMIHTHKTSVHPVSTGIPFLGFQVFPNHRRLGRCNGVNFQRRYKRMLKQLECGLIAPEQLRQSVHGWIAHVEHADTWGLRRSLLKSIIPKQPREYQQTI